ncbi:hypothetical protein VIBNISOn1_300003 [Vibrio nigripulchritudo SOn1]|uniref:NACHT domain-containing protein n=1 Tax=Vibrio nigripulchritudo SOn1 TaxID=1238450 RepID=A0AAV2VT44_9VIBR|nr:NACHT domain-containing protein [Vibrio nigripulchritudo]CCO47578.1 hypothetical protein VIBNISOn1_300003 [Vibrio nigripulchritudo SOn1]
MSNFDAPQTLQALGIDLARKLYEQLIKSTATGISGTIENSAKSAFSQSEIQLRKLALDTLKNINKQDVFEKVCRHHLCFETMSSGGEALFIDQIYYPLTLTTIAGYDSTRYKKPTETRIIIENNVMTMNQTTVIFGKAGHGKTTLLKKLYLNSMYNESIPFPVIITLRDINWKASLSIAQFLSDSIKKIGFKLSEEMCSLLLRYNCFTLMFDGFDEISDDNQSTVINLIEVLESETKTKSIITSRYGTSLSYSAGRFHKMNISDLEPEEAIDIINKNQRISGKYREELLEGLKNTPNMAKVLKTPILVDIYIATYSSCDYRPESEVEFYKNLFSSLATDHDRFKKSTVKRELKSQIKPEDLEKIFYHASFLLSLSDRNQYSFKRWNAEEKFSLASKKNCLHLKKEVKTNLALSDIIFLTSLIKREGDYITYIHKSIFEYASARHIRNSCEEYRKAYYKCSLEKPIASQANILSMLSNMDKGLFSKNYAIPLIKIFHKNMNAFFQDIKHNNRINYNEKLFITWMIIEGLCSRRYYLRIRNGWYKVARGREKYKSEGMIIDRDSLPNSNRDDLQPLLKSLRALSTTLGFSYTPISGEKFLSQVLESVYTNTQEFADFHLRSTGQNNHGLTNGLVTKLNAIDLAIWFIKREKKVRGRELKYVSVEKAVNTQKFSAVVARFESLNKNYDEINDLKELATSLGHQIQ